MADLNAVRQALATALTVIPGLRVSGDFQAQVNPPAAIIMPQPQQFLKFDALGGAVSYMLRIVLLGSYTEDASSQTLMDGFLSTTGPSSIAAVIAANPKLGGAVDNCNLDLIRGYSLMEWAGTQYLGSQLTVTVMT